MSINHRCGIYLQKVKKFLQMGSLGIRNFRQKCGNLSLNLSQQQCLLLAQPKNVREWHSCQLPLVAGLENVVFAGRFERGSYSSAQLNK